MNEADLEHMLERHETAITEDAKEIAELKQKVKTLAKEIERLNSIALTTGQAVASIPLWADKKDVDGQIRPKLIEFEKFRKLLSELKKLLFR